MMKSRGLKLLPILLVTAFPVWAQEAKPQVAPVPQMADQLEADLRQQWIAAQTVKTNMDNNVGEAMLKVLQDRNALKSQVVELLKMCGDKCKTAAPPAPVTAPAPKTDNQDK